ncbi:methyltransferase [Nonlabens spongiae]|uniref:Methyltransferase n=1 Tax=Nonlabens spongiae TaxID=331648 RepID=A0A1W6MKH1_9FLAO|nr:class I SAM-dependent methyltransferase [Nonlabens spongiae]ARN78114.1 methyltransferase [Nonlabens spongiae]
MHFLPQKIDDYIVTHSENEPQILKDLTRETYQKVLQPIMLSGSYQGRVLSMISHLVAPKRVLEIGTFTGYSALCLAEGMPDGSELITIDINEELEDLVERYFKRFRDPDSYRDTNNNTTLTQKIGDATQIIPELEGTFDLVFIDADKPNYVNYLDLIMDKVHSGSLIISDNVLWHGKVVEELDPKDKSTPILLEFNKRLKEDPRLQTVVLPIRDGLTLSRVV